MKITISDQAVVWYKDEMDLKEGSFVRFYVRYGGHSQIQQGFSLGISTEEPIDIGAEITKKGITFYIEEKDLWYFDEFDLSIELNAKMDEPEYRYIQ